MREGKQQTFIHTYKEYQELLKLPLGVKIERAENLILDALRKYKKTMVACSWGKDSIVLLHLIRNFCPNILVVYHNTGVEYPQNLAYRDRMLKEWNITNYVETVPKSTFFKLVEEYGYPKPRQMGTAKGGTVKSRGKSRSPKCCRVLKEEPAKLFHKENQIDCEFVGLQASESMVRRLSFLREGEAFDSVSYKCRIVRPIMIWNDKDIWQYQKECGIPRNTLYDLMPRNGCMPCTGFKNWKAIMAKANPKLYDIVSKRVGEPQLKCFGVWDQEALTVGGIKMKEKL